jgi:hypothetical protein
MMLSSAIVQSACAGTGNGNKDAEYSDGEDSTNSGKDLEHLDKEDITTGSVIVTPTCKRPFQDSQSEPDQSQAKKLLNIAGKSVSS